MARTLNVDSVELGCCQPAINCAIAAHHVLLRGCYEARELFFQYGIDASTVLDSDEILAILTRPVKWNDWIQHLSRYSCYFKVRRLNPDIILSSRPLSELNHSSYRHGWDESDDADLL